MCEHCGSRVHETFACAFPPGERHYAFRKPAGDGEVYDIERFEHHVRITEKRKYGWSRCFSLNEAFELATKLPDIIEEMLKEGSDDGDGQVDRGQAGE